MFSVSALGQADPPLSSLPPGRRREHTCLETTPLSTAAHRDGPLRPDEPLPALTGGGRDTSRLKETPQPRALRDRIAERVEQAVQSLDKSRPPGRSELEAAARRALADLALPEAYLGWTMVVAASAYWREQAAAVPFHRRLVLLPRCLRDAATCAAPCDAAGLHCRDCGACAWTAFAPRPRGSAAASLSPKARRRSCG